MTRNLHESKIEFQKTCSKSNCIDKSSVTFNKSTTKFEIRSEIKCETSNLLNIHHIK